MKVPSDEFRWAGLRVVGIFFLIIGELALMASVVLLGLVLGDGGRPQTGHVVTRHAESLDVRLHDGSVRRCSGDEPTGTEVRVLVSPKDCEMLGWWPIEGALVAIVGGLGALVLVALRL